MADGMQGSEGTATTGAEKGAQAGGATQGEAGASAQAQGTVAAGGQGSATSGATGSEPWYSGISHDDIKGVASKFSDEKAFFDALGLEVAGDDGGDWRSGIKDEKLREHAGRFTSLDDLVNANLESRKRLSQAVVPPGKDAKPEDIANYRKVVGIPNEPSGYEFPDLPEGREVTEEIKASRAAWAQRFHDLNIPAETAKALALLVNNDQAAYEKAVLEADKKFADDTDAALKAKWGEKDYERNTLATKRAIVNMANRAGVDIQEISNLKTSDGRFVMDHPLIRQIFAPVGLEMMEGNLGPAITDSERESINGRLTTLRDAARKAKSEGNNSEANRLYQEEQALLSKLNGNAPVVGARGRHA